jgi:hypothetical protein
MSDLPGRPTAHRSDPGIPLRDPRVQRLLWIGAISLFSLIAVPRLWAPVAFGWQRAERTLDVEEELTFLRQRHVRLQEELVYRKTAAGQALTAADVLALTYPHGHVVDLVPRADGPRSVSPPTLGERVKGWREKGRTSLHRKWRVLNLLVFNRRLPAERPHQAALGS